MKSGRLFFLAALLLLGFGVAARAEESVGQLLRQGNRAFAEQKYDEALEAYRQAAKLDPDRAEVQINIGNTLFRKKNFEEAVAAYNKALSAGDDNLRARALHNRGTAQLAKQDYDGAIDSFRRVLRLAPDDDDSKMKLMAARWLKKRVEEQQRQQQQQESQQCDNPQQNQDQQPQEDQQKQQEQQEQQGEEGEQRQEEQSQQQEEQQADESTPSEEEKQSQERQAQEQQAQEQQAREQQAEGAPADEQKQSMAPGEVDPARAAAELDALEKKEQALLKKLMMKEDKGGDEDKDW